MRPLYVGGPCTCSPHRYVRYVIPRGVPGLGAFISCRPYDAVERSSIAEHGLPSDAELVVKIGGLR